MAKSKKKIEKNTWVNIAAGTVAVIAILFGVKQCGDKQSAQRDAEEVRKSVIVDIRNDVDGLRQDAQDIKDLVVDHDNDIKDAIAGHDEKVNNKLDTLAAHCDSLKSSIAPCNKKQTRRTTTKPTVTKPTTTVTSTATEASTKTTVTTPNGSAVNTVTIGSGAHDNTVIIGAGAATTPADTVKAQCASATHTVIITRRRVRTR